MSVAHGTVLIMDTQAYLDCLASDYALLRTAASSADLDAQVPSCPGWTVSDLVFHVGEVYLHKVAIMRTGKWPEDWPPPELAREPKLALLDRGYAELTETFAELGPEAFAVTWIDDNQTVAFWIRRMAQETVIHRMDAQLAAGLPVSPARDDLAIDGVDEVLTWFLAPQAEGLAEVGLADLASPDEKDAVQVTAGPATWTVYPTATKATVAGGPPETSPHATIKAAPDPMLRWLWGRAPDGEVEFTGDPAWSAALRAMLVANTQ
jgi:uncharacterized protein (TIGR03083 family)